VPVPEATLTLSAQPGETTTLWRGQVRLDRYRLPKLQELRLVIREYETFAADAPGSQPAGAAVAAMPSTQMVRRLVYADVLTVPPIV
jgi:predicted transcriptional regulator